jgi:multicomponent Na+:H+ antiporter subunit C
MIRTFMPYALSAWLFVVGLFGIVRSKNLVHIVMCLAIAQSSTYVLLLQVGYRAGATAPIFKDIRPGLPTVDPIVQALVLTDLVIGVTVAALLLALALQAQKDAGSVDPEKIHPISG